MPLKRTGCWKAKLIPAFARSVTFLSVMSTPSKNEYTDGMLKNSKAKGTQYCYNQPITTREAYIAAVEAVEGWTATLKEMNEKLGK